MSNYSFCANYGFTTGHKELRVIYDYKKLVTNYLGQYTLCIHVFCFSSSEKENNFNFSLQDVSQYLHEQAEENHK